MSFDALLYVIGNSVQSLVLIETVTFVVSCVSLVGRLPAPAAVHWTTLTGSILETEGCSDVFSDRYACPMSWNGEPTSTSPSNPGVNHRIVSAAQHLSQIREYITV